MNWLQGLITRLWRHWLSLLGSVVAVLSGLGILVVATLEALGITANDYATLILLAALGLLFLAGLLSIPVGLALGHRQPTGETESLVDAVMRSGTLVRRTMFVVSVTMINGLILLVAGQSAVTHMNSPAFCGTTCHVPMQPEWDAYAKSPHGKVDCVACHVGVGAVAGVKAKLDGSRRVLAMMTGDFNRPIPPPHDIRNARETCMTCHSNINTVGTRVRVYPRFKDDKENTPVYSVALLRLGYVEKETGLPRGTHAHTSQRVKIRYQSLDAERTRIGRITVEEDGKIVATYERTGNTEPLRVEREMQCLDCHNRPAHIFARDAEVAIDTALDADADLRAVPFSRKALVDVLGKEHPTRDAAVEHFKKVVPSHYAATWPEEKPTPEQLDKVASTASALYLRNVYPEMKIGFGTYMSQRDHRDPKDLSGCFRCHSSDFEAKNLAPGREGKLGQSCDSCHEMLASEENPAEFEDVLQMLVPVK